MKRKSASTNTSPNRWWPSCSISARRTATHAKSSTSARSCISSRSSRWNCDPRSSPGELLRRLHPTPALGPLPRTDATMRRLLEWRERLGCPPAFGAPFGLWDHGRFDAVVAIRGVWWDGKRTAHSGRLRHHRGQPPRQRMARTAAQTRGRETLSRMRSRRNPTADGFPEIIIAMDCGSTG